MASDKKTKLMTVPEAAKVLRLSDVRVRQLCQEGRLGKKVGSRYILEESEIRRFSKVNRPAGRKSSKPH
jgi:excisionase family DNA binding protein